MNEENAVGGPVVTAASSGALGVTPAVLAYSTLSVPGAKDEGLARFRLNAGAISTRREENDWIWAAEVGCQGEVAVARSMVAAGLSAVLGGTQAQSRTPPKSG